MRLRELRTSAGLSLRQLEKLSGVNNGYLSQLERDEIAQPTPSVLKKIAEVYGEPLGVLMQWAGYLELDSGTIQPNKARALRYMGKADLSDSELEAIKAVLAAIRTQGR